MQSILTIVACSCLAVLISEASGMVQWIKYKTMIQHLKPFDCPLCLAWWLACLVFVLHKDYPHVLLYAAISAILAILLSNAIKPR